MFTVKNTISNVTVLRLISTCMLFRDVQICCRDDESIFNVISNVFLVSFFTKSVLLQHLKHIKAFDLEAFKFYSGSLSCTIDSVNPILFSIVSSGNPTCDTLIFSNFKDADRAKYIFIASIINKVNFLSALLNGCSTTFRDENIYMIKASLISACKKDFYKCARLLLNYISKDEDLSEVFQAAINFNAKQCLRELVPRYNIFEVEYCIKTFVKRGIITSIDEIISINNAHRKHYEHIFCRACHPSAERQWNVLQKYFERVNVLSYYYSNLRNGRADLKDEPTVYDENNDVPMWGKRFSVLIPNN